MILNWQYRHLTIDSDRLNKLNDKDKNKKVLDMIIEIKKEYLDVALKDPFLPKELLPSDWFGYEAKKLVKNL